MAKNRKSQAAGMRFGPAVGALLLCIALAGVGWCYLWQKGQVGQLGRQVKERERTLEGLRIQNDKLRESLAGLRKADALKRRIIELNLGLAQPVQGQVESLPEPPAAAPPPPMPGPDAASPSMVSNR
jgi:hypothetical protein